MNKAAAVLAAILLSSILASTGCVRAPSRQPELVVKAEQYQRRGVKAYQRGDYVTARSMFDNALRIYESLDDARGSVSTLVNLIETALRSRDYALAENYVQQAGMLAERNDLSNYRSRVTLLASTLALVQGDVEDARTLLEPLLPVFKGDSVTGTLDDVSLAAIANRTRIEFAGENAEPALWVRRFADALQRSGQDQPLMRARLLRFQARIAEENGEAGTAARLLDQALSQYKLALSQPGIAATLLQSGKLAMRRSQWLEARRSLRRSAAVYTRLRDAKGTAEAMAALAEIERQLDNRDIAVALQEMADRIDRGDPVNWPAIRKLVQEQ